MKRWMTLAALAAAVPIGPAAAALALGLALTGLSGPSQAQTAEQLEQQYGREAMAQALDVKRRFDLYGIHFETGQAAIQQQSQGAARRHRGGDEAIPDLASGDRRAHRRGR